MCFLHVIIHTFSDFTINLILEYWNTPRFNHLFYISFQIYSSGSIVESGKIPMSNRQQIWKFNATSSMAPKAKLILFFVRSDGEVIADGLTMNVQGVFENKVKAILVL